VKREPRFLFVFSGGLSRRVDAFESSTMPREATGYLVLRARGFDAEAVDPTCVKRLDWRVGSHALQRLYVIPRSGLGYRIHQALDVRKRLTGDAERWIIGTTDSLALPILGLKARGKLPNPVVYMSIGLVDRIRQKRVHARLARRYVELMQHAEVIFAYGPEEVEQLQAWAPASSVRLMPFGVDAAWWQPPSQTSVPARGTILSIGSDPARDFPTLAAAVNGLPVRTTIVSRLARKQGVEENANIRIVEASSLTDVRNEMWMHELVVIPTRHVRQPSGQSTAIHAMAAGKVVVMSNASWAWDAGLKPDTHFVHVPPEDTAALRATLTSLLEHPERTAEIGMRAQRFVQTQLTPARQAEAILYAIAEADGDA